MSYELTLDGHKITDIDEESLSDYQKRDIIRKFCAEHFISEAGVRVVKKHYKVRKNKLS